MNKKVWDFKNFVLNEYDSNLDEGYIGDKMKKAGIWIVNLATAIKDRLIKLIPSGPKKGLPAVKYFSPADGSIVKQIKTFYAGTPFGNQLPLSSYIRESESDVMYTDDKAFDLMGDYFESLLEGAQVPLEHPDSEMTNVGVGELKRDLMDLYKMHTTGEFSKPIFIYGAPGIGKTEIIAECADELNVGLWDNIDIQFMAKEDFLGIPSKVDVQGPKYGESGEMLDVGKGVTRSNPTALLPINNYNGLNHEGGFVFLDEFNKGAGGVISSLMQFIQKRKIADYQLPDKWVLVAAGNRDIEAEVTDLGAPLFDRFTVVNFVPKVEDWLDWARQSGHFKDEFVVFVEKNAELFHYLDSEKIDSGATNYPTPRSWTDAAKILKGKMKIRGVETWQELPMKDVHGIYAKSVGNSAANKLKAYLEIIKKVSERDLNDMVNDPMKAKVLPKVNNFISIMFGLFSMAIQKAIELSPNDVPTAEQMYNLLVYFNRYGEDDPVASLYSRFKDDYDFEVSQDVIDNKELPENQLKIKGARIVHKNASDKDLIVRRAK